MDTGSVLGITLAGYEQKEGPLCSLLRALSKANIDLSSHGPHRHESGTRGKRLGSGLSA